MITVCGERSSSIAQKEKIAFLREKCEEEKPFFLAFAESHLNDRIKESEYELEGYSHTASHRSRRTGGGVIIYVSNDHTYQTLASTSDEMCSLAAIYINEMNLVVFMAYRPPPNYKNQYNGEVLENSFKNIVIDNIKKIMSEFNTPTPDIILAGDFNFPKASWLAGIGKINPDLRSNKRSLKQLIEIATEFNLLQKVSEGTRETRSGTKNILELIFTNNHELISNIYIQSTEITDHKYIVCETSHMLLKNDTRPSQNNEPNLSSFNYETADWENIRKNIKLVKWSEILEIYKSAADKLKVIMETVMKIVEENCTKFKNRNETRKNNIPRDRKILLRKKKILKTKLKNHNISCERRNHLELNIRNIEKELLMSHKNEKINNEARAIRNIKSNPKHFFTYTKKKLKTNNVIGPFKVNGEIVNSLKEICNKISDQYSSSFSVPDQNFKIANPREFFDTNVKNEEPMLIDFNFTENSIVNAIKDITNNSAPGPDHFPTRLLKECSEELSKPLYILWRYSLDKGDIAPLLKTAVICPILKPGSQRNQPSAYRPVSLTSHIIKVFERIIRKALVEYLQKHDLLPENQHGFLSGRSTLSQLLNHIEEAIRAYEEGKATDTVYLDFAKAFDKVDHNILCHKLRKLGITGKVGVWIKDFLTGRFQQVSANGLLSDAVPVTSGVPQGTVLGPILFIIMISDLGKELVCSTSSKYADDTKNTAKVSNRNDAEHFQKELDQIVYPWAPTNNMCLNGDKFEYHRIGKNLCVEKYSYKNPDGETIQEKEHIKDLGIFISNDLTWTRQIEEAVAKARIMAGWTLRTFITREREPMMTIWNSIVRPKLDYCSPLWSPRPSNFKEIDLLEQTQRYFMRQIKGMETLDYSQRLKSLKTYSIQRRHERYKVLYIYKIKEGFVPNISKNHALKFTYHRRHGCRCEVPKYPLRGKSIRAREDSFALTACNIWNSLPRCIRDINGKDVAHFKRKLDKALSYYPDIPRCSLSGHSHDMHGRKSNSIVDHYNNRRIRQVLDNLKIFEEEKSRKILNGRGYVSAGVRSIA